MKILVGVIPVFLLLKLSSCVNTRPLQYVQGQFDTARLSEYVIPEPIVQVGDVINITVYSDNPTASALYNLGSSDGVTGIQSNATGYIVDKQGNIPFPGLGNLQVAGLTKQQLIDLLNSKLTRFLQNPYYNIRFLNYKVTMVGEVTREGVYNIPDEKLNIFQAIGLAGGLTIYARRENVMIIREANGKRDFARLDLTKPEVLKSPYFHLQQNDMIIVEQSKSKTTASEQVTVRNITLLSTLISTVAIVITVFRR